ncbi:hypothetical protein [Streptomyces ficellus]|uniref:hypothetical protein n=1 Tax=Streptomyces ficellus TaxID=1977088 RepID=UPI0012E8900F|nr:hypothetical protein [Streptomyces ficellus]
MSGTAEETSGPGGAGPDERPPPHDDHAFPGRPRGLPYGRLGDHGRLAPRLRRTVLPVR